jgi:CheY-like chemotaxis protein
MMPEIDGIELARWIRNVPQYRTNPIVMLTAMSEKSYIDRAFIAGASDYVTKPFDTVDIVTRVQLAERQLKASRAVRDTGNTSAEQLLALREQLDERYRAPLAEPIVLENVEGLIDFLALQNYLLQMSRGAFVGTSLFALRVANVGDLYNACSPALFHDILADVAECALAALSSSECILAYSGNGSFAGVVGLAHGSDLDDLEMDINLRIERLQLRDDQNRPLDIRVVVGAPQAIGVFHSGQWVIAQMRRVIEDLAWSVPKSTKQTPAAQTGTGRFFRSLVRAKWR